MTSFSRLHHLATALLHGVLASSLPAFAASAKKPAAGVAGMPSGLRKEAAFHLLSKYRTEGTGKPEISAKPAMIEGSTPAYRLRVRYPAQQGARCFTVQSGPADAEGNFRFSVETHTGSAACDEEGKFTLYRELDQMMARIRTCEQKGEARCLVSDPASRNRQILVLR